MTKFTFIGDALDKEDRRSELQTLGKVFPRGVPVEVTDETSIRKLRGNRLFVEGGAGAPKPQAAPVQSAPEADPRDAEIAFLRSEVARLEAALADQEADPADPEDGADASAPEMHWRTMSRAGLVAWAEKDLGLKLDARLKLETLQAQVADYIDAENAKPA